MAGDIGKFIVEYKRAHPSAAADEILNNVRKKWPKSATSVASISSTLSRAGLATGRIATPSAQMIAPISTNPKDMPAHDPNETDEQALARINKRYDAMGRLGTK